jgi:uncharacterized iron-regulated protein
MRGAAIAICLAAAGCASGGAAATGPDTAAADDGEPIAEADPPGGWRTQLDRGHPLAGRIYDVPGRAFVREVETYARMAAAADYLLLGESHDNADHHLLQARVLEVLIAMGRRPAVVFEMIGADMQGRIDRLAAASPGGPLDPQAVREAVEWDESGWPDWSLYEPIFRTALDARLPIVAAGLPRRLAREIARGKAELDPALVERHRLDRPLPPEIHEGLVEDLAEAHCGHLPRHAIDPMVLIQRARDASMADALERAGAKHGAVLIAGKEHVRADRGVPAYLRGRGLDRNVSLAMIEVASERREAEEYAGAYGGRLPFQFAWFTPRASDADHCAELKKQIEQHRASGKDP